MTPHTPHEIFYINFESPFKKKKNFRMLVKPRWFHPLAEKELALPMFASLLATFVPCQFEHEFSYTKCYLFRRKMGKETLSQS